MALHIKEPSAKDLVRKMLTQDPKKRLTSAQVLGLSHMVLYILEQYIPGLSIQLVFIGLLVQQLKKIKAHRHQMEFQERVVNRRQAGYNRMKVNMEDRSKEEKDIKRKMLFYVKTEEEMFNKLREEEEARKCEEAERRKKEEAEHRTKLDEIA